MRANEALKIIDKVHDYPCPYGIGGTAWSFIRNCIEKQIPYKPKEYEDRYYGCRCGNILLMKWREYLKELTPKSEGLPYCLACGQALDWSDNNE